MLVHRPARSTRHLGEQPPKVIEAPPTLGQAGGGGPMQALLPITGVLGSVGMMAVTRSTLFMVVGAAMLVATLAGVLGSAMSQRGRAGRDRRKQRERYLDYLERLREEFAKTERTVRSEAGVLDPPSDALVDCARDPARLWERRRTDSDFLRVRCGTGRIPVGSATVTQHPGAAMDPPDPFMMAEAQAVVRRFALMPEMPLTVPLDQAGNVSVVGDRDGVVTVARSLLLQSAVFHAPEDVELAACFPPAAMKDWDWLNWLPHVLDPERQDGPHPFRRIAPSPQALAGLIADDLAERAKWASEARRGSIGEQDTRRLTQRLLVLHDTYGQVSTEVQAPGDAQEILGLTVLHLVADRTQEPSNVSVRICVQGDEVVVEDLRGPEPLVATGQPDRTATATAEGVARMLAPLRLSKESAEEDAYTSDVDVMGMLGIDDPGTLDRATMWSGRSERNFLRVPIGLDQAGSAVMLDLKESAQLGMGPHGLCVGATGSGKSELLRTLVLGLLATHTPDDLAMVLIDYKGGATFAPFDGVPHIAGIITNLVDDPTMTERAYASLAGEVQRRQRVLRDAGNVANITDYRLLRRQRPELEPLPHLFVIIDEFGELLTVRPDFIDLFLSIGRIGRSIGVHLLLSSQRIESGQLRGLDTYLSYRLGLRTFSEDESRSVLDTTDAFHLPPLPGFGYLKVDVSVYQRFKAAYVSGPYAGRITREPETPAQVVRPYLLTPYQQDLKTLTPAAEEDKATDRTAGPTVLDMFVSQIKPVAKRVAQIWLPPLPAVCTLDQLAGDPRPGPRGLQFPVGPPQLAPPIGVLDDPRRQRQEVFRLDLTAAGGHCALIGGPQSGKTTTIRTIVTALAHSHTPAEVAIYGLDLAGGGLQPLRDLPHVGGIAIRTDRNRLRRTLEEVRGMIDHRERVFRDRGIDTMETLRELHGAGQVPELPCADVVLLVDNFGAIRTQFDEIDEPIADILQRGSGYGVHVVAAMLRWNDVRMQLQSLFGTVLELRLNDPSDSMIDTRLQGTLRSARPGRMLTPQGKLFAQVALPRVDGRTDDAHLSQVLESQSVAIRSAWSGALAPQVRVLPFQVGRRALPSSVTEPERVPIGLDEAGLAPVLLDLSGDDGSLVAFGDNECGKTNLLRLVMQQLADRYTASSELVFGVMDPRRSLLDVVKSLPEDYIGGHATTVRQAAGLASAIAAELERRLPDESGTSAPGPRIVVVVDDYDLLTTGGQSPLEPFLPYVASGRDLDLHFVVARRASGASRSMYEPFLQSVLESGSAGLVMAGDPSEGQIFTGARPGSYPAGRGLFVRRGDGPVLIQTALADGTGPLGHRGEGGTS
ncbi:type VII secretion protein EccCa [Kribbella sp. NPDC003505]|uniref:type VII secretion protein EccCa n=1 Tax=Kribbella sp. NPDC003505 TaxID=3154448 RepID=UPI0033A82D2E